MSPLLTTITNALLGFVLLFMTGFGLRLRGKPYGFVLNTAHKLVALGTLAYVGWLAAPAIQSGQLGAGSWLAIVLTAALFLVTIISGALLTVPRRWPAWISTAHLLLPFGTMLTTLICLVIL